MVLLKQKEETAVTDNEEFYQESLIQIQRMARELRQTRIQVVLLGLKDTKQKHPRVIILENQLGVLLRQEPRRDVLIDEILDELGELIILKPEHYKIARAA